MSQVGGCRPCAGERGGPDVNFGLCPCLHVDFLEERRRASSLGPRGDVGHSRPDIPDHQVPGAVRDLSVQGRRVWPEGLGEAVIREECCVQGRGQRERGPGFVARAVPGLRAWGTWETRPTKLGRPKSATCPRTQANYAQSLQHVVGRQERSGKITPWLI